jgi:hypothetical protein
MPDVTPDPIMKIAMGFTAAKHLFAANEVGLFEGLAAGPASIAELAKKTNIPARTLAIVANAMVSLGMLELRGERYRNSDSASTFVAGRSGHDMRPMLRFFNPIGYPTWQKLDQAVRTGKGQAQFGGFSEEEQRMHKHSRLDYGRRSEKKLHSRETAQPKVPDLEHRALETIDKIL